MYNKHYKPHDMTQLHSTAISHVIDINDDIAELKNDIQNLKNEQREMRTSLEYIITTIKSTHEMISSHIQFINTTYSSLKFPLNYVKSKINMLAGYKQDTFSIKNSDNDSDPVPPEHNMV